MKCFKDTIKHSLILALVLTLLLCALPGISAIAAAGSPPSSLNSAFGSFYGGDGADFVLDEVLIPAASRQNAQEIADAYSLKLLSYAWGIAVLAASDPLETVAQSDLLNSLMGGFAARSEIPKLSLNRLYSTYTDDRKYDMEHSYFSSAGPYAPYDRTDREGYAKTPPGRGYEEKYGSRISGAGEEKYGKAYPGKVDEERYASSHSEKTDRERYTRTLSYEDDGERYASVPPYKYSEGMQANSITPGFDRHSDQGSLSYGFETSIKSKVIDLNSKLNTQHSKLGLQSSPAVSGSDSQWHHELMDTERAWDLSLGEGALVAVIDTGIDLKHPKFDGRISETSYDSHADRIGIEYVQDDEGHGTHVSGIIAASLDGDEDVCGVAPKADILMIKANIPSAPNFFESASLYRAINYAAANGADVINMSLGRNYADGWNEDELEHEIIINAVKNGVTVVCAAGNESNNHAGFPAAYPETIAVSALRWGGIFDNSYSNYGPEIDIAAPGSDIYSTANGGDYMYLSGTSMASPNVAGVAALIKSLHPEYTPGQVRDVLCETARAAGALGKNDYYGWGIVNAYGAVLGVDALYKVTYDFNDGERESVTVRVAPKSMLIEPTWPERDGYAFDGWFISSTDEEFDFTAAVENDLTLEAKWVETEDGMYILEFPDPNFRREVLRQLNQEDGGKRRESNFVKDDLDLLAAWDFLYVSYMSIFDMTGLKYLSGLIWLYCSDNYLVALDVSNSTELESLDCSDNQINELDLANNNKLSYLNCSRNEFTNLDLSECTTLEVLYSIQNYWLGNLEVSKNINLRELFCSVCQLTELDVSNNSNLEVLSCSDNLLTELDITKNTKLGGYNSGYFVYPGLDCSYNQLTTLDVSKNLELNIIICGGNQLTELDVSKNIALEELFCGYNLLTELDLTKNTGLMHLGCSNNRLTTLDVSKNTKLTHIGCRNNNLTDLDVSKNIDLSFINCYNNQLTKLDVSNNIILEGLNCNGNLLTELYVAHADLSGTMGWWYISGNEIYDSGLQCSDNRLTALDISQNPALKIMDCGFNFLTELDVSANAGLEWLNCTYNYMENIDKVTGWETISGLIPNNTFYFNPQCSGNLPTGKDITASFKDFGFLMAVRNIIDKPEGPILDYDVARIRELYVSYWDIGRTIYDLSGIEHFGSLTYLDCSDQQLEALDLSNNGALRELSCGYSRLRELNLSNNPELRWIYCYSNYLSTLDLSNNPSLISLNCSNNQLTELDVSNSQNLMWLYCNFNQLEALDVSHNILLEDLGVWNNQLTVLDLSNNPELRYLDSDGNRLIALDLSHCKYDLWLYSSGQRPNLTLEWDEENGYYSTAIELNNPIFYDYPLTYEDGILKSPNRRFNNSYFQVETGKPGYTLSGNLNLIYRRDYDPDDCIEINEDNFPDPVFREWLLNPWNIYGYGADGVLDPGEIEEITSINVNFRGISDLTGIEYFTFMETLQCWGNNLSFLPKLPSRLRGIDCDDNRLIALDLSQCENYFEFYYASGQHPSLALEWDVENGYYSAEIELNSPIFGDYGITYKDGLLISPSRRYNNIYFQVETGKPGYTLSGYLNLIYGPRFGDTIEINEDNFPDPNFQTWLLNQWFGDGGLIYLDEIEEITEIDISYWDISDLTGIEYFTSLEYLYCWRANLTFIPKLPKSLMGLDCGYNRLTALDLSYYENDLGFYGNEQHPSLTLEWDEVNGYYSTEIELNNPSFTKGTVTYEDGILKSSNRRLNNIYFQVETGKPGYYLSGYLNLTYGERPIEFGEYIEINEINFPDSYFRYWMLGQWFGRSGVIFLDEIEEITDFYMYYEGISDLTGINYFTSLETLVCWGNKLKYMPELPGSLIHLECGNDGLTSLPELPDGLTYLDCSYNNLTSLPDLPNELVVLICYDNKLASLPKLPVGLTGLDCSYNRLTALDLSQCRNLTWFGGDEQNPQNLSMEWDESNGYSTAIELKNPYFAEKAVIYEGGILKSPSRHFNDLYFEVETGRPGYILTGYLSLTYKNGPLNPGEIEINEINFPDSIFRDWLLKQWYGTDGILDPDEIEGITDIDVNFMDISDLTGIEYFTSLETLRCWGNNLSFLPKLPSGLVGLDCDDNRLIALDLSHCKKDFWFYYSSRQQPTLTMEWDEENGYYSTAVELNNPYFGNEDISYEDGILKSPSRFITNTYFKVETGKPDCTLSGTMNFNYRSIRITVQPAATTFVTVGKVTGSLNIEAIAPGDLELTYQWYRSFRDINILDEAISGATSVPFPIPEDLEIGIYYYYCMITATIDGILWYVPSNLATVTVNELTHAQTPVISEQPIGRPVNVGESVTLSVIASISDDGELSYQWYSSGEESSDEGKLIEGATSETYIPPTTDVGKTYYFVVITNNNDSVTGETIAKITSTVVAVTVNAPVDAKVPFISEQPEGKSVSVGGNVTLSVTAISIDNGILSYQWYSNITASISGAEEILDADEATYTPSIDTVGTYYYYVVVTNTNTDATGEKTASVISNVAAVIVSERGSYTGGGSGTASFTVTFESNGGSVIAKQTVVSGAKAIKPANPTKDGYLFAGWFTDKELTKEYSFDATVSTNLTLYAKWEESEPEAEPEIWQNPFTDVKTGDWFYDHIRYMCANGLMNGTGPTLFSPKSSVTRGMLVTVLHRLDGEEEMENNTSFADVKAGMYYSKAVAWAEANEIVNGYPDNTFRPDQPVSRQEIATILLRYAKYIDKGPEEKLSAVFDFADAAIIADWALEGVAFCAEKGIVEGRPDKTFDPTANATRAEFATMIHRFAELIK